LFKRFAEENAARKLPNVGEKQKGLLTGIQRRIVVKISAPPFQPNTIKKKPIHSSFFVYTLTEEKMASANLTSRK
jgi:hypothetical protein